MSQAWWPVGISLGTSCCQPVFSLETSSGENLFSGVVRFFQRRNLQSCAWKDGRQCVGLAADTVELGQGRWYKALCPVRTLTLACHHFAGHPHCVGPEHFWFHIYRESPLPDGRGMVVV